MRNYVVTAQYDVYSTSMLGWLGWLKNNTNYFDVTNSTPSGSPKVYKFLCTRQFN